MSGRKGRSGRKPLSIEEHLRRGTFRPHRHGPRPPQFAGATALQPAVEAPPLPAHVSEGLRSRGLLFVRELWDGYGQWSPAQLRILHECGAVIDTLGDLEAQVPAGTVLLEDSNGDTSLHPILRARRQERQSLAVLVRSLGLKEG